MKMKKILLVGSQHGDELLGDKLIRRIRLYHPDLLNQVDFCVANPKAHRLKKRYVETDMNRSYLREPNTYEARRAAKLLTKTKADGYNLVLDLHTTTDKMETCFIAPSVLSKAVTDFLKTSQISKVVVMKHEVIKTSLIGNLSNAVSIEASMHSIDKTFLEQLIASIAAYVNSDIPGDSEKDLFYVDLLVDKSKFSALQFKRMKNFELFESKFYPILIRSSSYKKYKAYRGFGATVKLTKTI